MNQSITPRTAFAGGIATLALSAAASAQFTRIEGFSGLGEGISNTGVVAGSFGTPEYFMWTELDGPMLIGGTVPGNGVGGQGKVSADGTRICGSFLNPASGLNEMAWYDVATGTWTPLGGIGGSVDAEISGGWGISNDGQKVVGLAWTAAGGPGSARAVIADISTAMVTDLGSTVVERSTRANGVDDDGDVVVGWQDGAGRQGAVWVDGVQELIFMDSGDAAFEAFGVSGDGQWVTGIGFGSPFGVGNAYRYNTVTDAYEQLPNLTVGGESRMAGTAVSPDGSMIVGGTWGLGPATFGKAIVWREGIGTVLLSEYLDELGIAYPSEYVFNFVSDMSADGTRLVGWGSLGGFAANETFVIELPSGTPCVADLDNSGSVDFGDLTSILSAWGPCSGCPADLDGNGDVGFTDLTAVLSGWGPCP
ncbi:MAG: hypothetical protein AB8G96_07335 [Phycisphaerales bacterium]